jgi:outer membrane protein assembly factor BamB
MPRPPLRAAVLAALLALPAQAAPDAGPSAFTARDPQIDAGLEKAAEKERQGDLSAAVRHYVEVEVLLEKARAKGDARPVTEVGPGLDRGVGRYIRDRIAALPADAQREYLQTIDPRAREALVRALATRLPDEIEAVLARYPLASIADRALPALAELALERGEVGRAVRAWERLEARSTDPDAARRAAWMRFVAAVLGRDRAAARSALASWAARGGDPAAARRIGSRELPPRTVLAELERTAGGTSGPALIPAFDLGGTGVTLPLVSPELDDELARKLAEPPTHQEPVVDAEARLVIVADELGVRAVPLPQARAAGPVGPAAWSFSLKDDVSAPGRVEAAICRPALGPGRVYATLHRNRPARVTTKGEAKKPGEPQQIEVERLRDWRVVAIDRATGGLVWDAAERSEQASDAFDAIARNAEWVSSPLHADGGVFVLVLERQGDLRASLVRLDDATGEVRWRSFLASRPGFDHLGLGAPPPPPALGPTGDVVVATGLGVVASVEPTRGEPSWVARYSDTPESSQSALVGAGRRFRATSPLVGRGAGARAPIVVAPVDGGELLGLDPDTGETRWRAPRGGARTVVEAPSGDVLLVGTRVVALERETGRVRFTGDLLPGVAIAPPLVLGEEVVVVTKDGPAWSIVRVALDRGTVRSRWRLSAAEVGAPLLAGAALATVGPTRLTLWSTLAEEQKRIEDRLGRGPRADLFLGALRARRGEVELALQHLGRASVRGALEETLRLQARGAAFDLLAAEAFAARTRGDQAKFLALGERALAFAWGQADDPEREPTSKDEQALAGRTADLLLAYADAHARDALGLKELAAARAAGLKAVAACQALVRLPATALARSPAGARVGARAWASERVRAVVARLGPEVYAGPAARAEEEYRAARAADQTPALARMADLYPASPRAADARWALAQAHEQRGLRGEAARELERLVRDWPADPRRPDALARLALTYEKLRRTTRARAALEALVAIDPEPRITAPPAEGAPPAEVAARAWAEPLRLRARAGDAEARFAADAAAALDVPLRRALRTATELSSEGAALSTPGQPWAAPDDLIVLRRDGAGREGSAQAPLDALEVRRVSDGAVVAVIPSAPRVGAGARLEPTFVRGPRGALLVVPWSDRLEAWSVEPASSGVPSRAGPAWITPIPAGDGLVVLGATPVHEVRGAAEGVVVLTGRNDLVLVDPATGQERWRRTMTRKALGGLTTRSGLALCLSTVPAAVDAVRLSDGQVAWTSGAPQPGQPGGQRLSCPVWLDGSTLVFIEDSARVVALEAQTGKRRFTAAASDGAWFLELFPSPDGASFVARTQGAMGAGLRLFEAVTGQELWKDDGWGAQRPGGPPAAVDGPRPTIDAVVVGDDAVYTFRTIARRVEVWAQERTLGKQVWTWQAPIGSQGVPVVIETPTLLVIPRTNGFGQRVTLSVLARGTGRNLETHQLPGRRLLGRGALVRAGVLVVSTDRGLFGLTSVDDEALGRDLARAVQALEEAPGDSEARARVATLLDLGGRGDEALELLASGLQTERIGVEAFDRLFASLSALAEAAADNGPRHLDARRMPRPPEIDGELNDWWRPWSSVTLRGPRFVQPIQQPPGVAPPRWSGDEDLSAELYLGWDDGYLYFALDVADTNLRPYDSEAERWIGDCLLMAIDCLGDGGEVVLQDDVLLSLALTLPKKDKDEDEEKDPQEQTEEEKNKPEGRYFVRRKDDGSGAIYEAAIPWSLFEKNGAAMTPGGGPAPGLEFGFNVVLTDDDGEHDPLQPDGRGALKTLEITPSVLLHAEKSRLWQGFIPGRFARITLR